MRNLFILAVFAGLMACSPNQDLKEENEQLKIQLEEMTLKVEELKVIAEESASHALQAQVEAEAQAALAKNVAERMAEQLKNCK